MNKKYVSIAIIVLVVLGGLAWIVQRSQPAAPMTTTDIDNTPSTQQPVAETETKLYIGDSQAPAEIIEYGDYKCPSCGQFHQQAGQQLTDTYINDGRLKIEYRPLNVIGPDSERSAIGAYCANEQQLFSEYHDAVYNYMWDNHYASGELGAEFEDVLTTEVLGQLAADNGLDEAEFSDCLDSGRYSDATQNNIVVGAQQDGVMGTPSFVVDGQRVVGPQPFSVFEQLVELQLR